MIEDVARYWWVFLVRGLLAIAFGIAALVWPQITVWALVIVFGAYVLIDGVLDLGMAMGGTGRAAPGSAAVAGGGWCSWGSSASPPASSPSSGPRSPRWPCCG